jgi:hypothetical protein
MRVFMSDLVKRNRVWRWNDEKVATTIAAKKAGTVEPECQGERHEN